jgi:hypothetical protein
VKAKLPVHLHIERLVIDAALVPAGRGARLRHAVETELAQLFRERGLTPQTQSPLASLSAGAFQVRDSAPARIGQQIAQAVYTSLNAATK